SEVLEMKRHPFIAALVFGVGVVTLGATPRAGEPPRGSPDSAHADHWALLDQYCTDCHNTTDWAGGIALDVMDHDRVHDEAETWEKVIRKLRGGLMPPPGRKQPEASQL